MTTNTPNPPSGWYPDARDPHLLRYWNGLAWTAQTRPVASAPAPAPAPAMPDPGPAPSPGPISGDVPPTAQPLTPHGYPPAPSAHPGAVPAPAQPGWGPPQTATHYCRACSAPLMQTATMCPRCGTVVGVRKDKTTAVLLAVFLSGWTWLYTYQRDAWKFWTAFGLSIAGFALLFIGIGVLVFLAIWIWSIVDVAIKDEAFYERYPHG